MSRRSINLGSKTERVWEWIFPSVIIAIAPVIAQYFSFLSIRDFIGYGSHSFIEIISQNGELLIVSVALVAESLSEMWRRQIPRWQRNYIGSLCIGFVIVSTLLYASLPNTYTNPSTVSIISFNMFVFGFMGCVACKIAGRS